MSTYYNENDPYAAQWLRNLIAAGHLPAGDVDERDIRTVQPDDVARYTSCHWFAGIGGWPYALRLAGWSDDRLVWTGSCPCQPFSVAGKQTGANDERHLWPVWRRLISECLPSVVVGEQVAEAITHGWLDEVASDLEAEGYSFASAVLPAFAVGAPHQRDRIFFIADSVRPDATGWHENRRRLSEPQPLGKEWAFSGWNGGQANFCLLDDGLPASLAKKLAHGFGNAIVAPLAAEFIAAYLEVRP